MKIKSLNVNIICKFIRMTLGIVFILLTTPYTTRVLGKEYFGKIEYFAIIVGYITLFTGLGLPNYGIREVAKYRNDEFKLNSTVVELVSVSILTTILGYLLLLGLFFLLPELKQNILLIIILSLDIFLSNLGIEWFYQGMEDQVYITKKFIIVRLICLIILFLFVKKSEDYLIYAFVFVLLSKGSNIFNLINLKTYLKLEGIKIKNLEIKKHLKPIFIIFLGTIAASIYSKIDIFMIGKFSDNSSVGIYVVAYRIISLLISLTISIPTICMPRICNFLHNNEMNEYIKLMKITFRSIIFFILPMSSFLFFLSEELIGLFAGKLFLEAATTLKLMIPLISINSFSNYLGIQILYPKNLEKKYTQAIVIVCLCNIILNYYFINNYGYNGAVLGSLISELIGICILIKHTKNDLEKLKLFTLNETKYFLATFFGVFIFFFDFNILIKIVFYLFSYLIILIVLKEKFVLSILIYTKEKSNKFLIKYRNITIIKEEKN